MSRSTGEILSDILRNRTVDLEDGSSPSSTGIVASNGIAGGNTIRSGETGSIASGGRERAVPELTVVRLAQTDQTDQRGLR